MFGVSELHATRGCNVDVKMFTAHDYNNVDAKMFTAHDFLSI